MIILAYIHTVLTDAGSIGFSHAAQRGANSR